MANILQIYYKGCGSKRINNNLKQNNFYGFLRVLYTLIYLRKRKKILVYRKWFCTENMIQVLHVKFKAPMKFEYPINIIYLRVCKIKVERKARGTLKLCVF